MCGNINLFKTIEQAEREEENYMAFDYSKLRGRIIEKCGTLGAFAKKMDVSGRTISLKLNNKAFWTQDDILKACKILDISGNDIAAFFYELCSK